MLTASLPVPLNPLIGRQRELSEVGGLLSQARLVTLTGAGGSGKTRLAIEAARRVSEPASPAAWVELAPLSDPEMLADHVAAALEARPGPGRNAVEAIVAALRSRPLLLVIDNCEHLVERCAALVEALLRSCPSLHILATSREPLGVPGERLWLVPPLSLPRGESLPRTEAMDGSEAIELFVARAHEANPSFKLGQENAEAVVAICRRLDGLPLALELAAARTRVLTVEQIASRLDDAFRLLTTGGRTSLPRQKTLRGTFDWSFDLLNREQQLLLQRLSVFAGTFSLAAVEAVCGGDGIESHDLLDVLSALVDRSLVLLEPEADEARYRILETVRQYGLERLRESEGEGELRRRHAAYYLAFAERLAPALFGGAGGAELMRQLDQEHDNFRAVADWAVSPGGSGEVALRLVVAIHWYWFARGLLLEGWRRANSALDKGGPAAPPGLRGRALVALGVIAFWLGNPQATRREAEESVDLLRGEEDPFSLAYALAMYGSIVMFDRPEWATEALAEARTLVDALPVSVLTAFVAYWQGQVAQLRRDGALARASFVRGAALGRKLGHLPALAHSLTALGRLESDEGNPTDAHRILLESLALHIQSGDPWGRVQTLKYLARATATLGDPELAVRLLAGARRLGEEVGTVDTEAEAAELAAFSSALRAELGPATYDSNWASGAALKPEALAALARKNPWATRILTLPAEADPTAPDRPAPEGALSARPAPHAAIEAQVRELPEAPPSEAAPAPAFEVSALGPLRIRVAGEPVAGERWSSARTRELLVFLLLRPEGATKEEVGLALWPEATATQVRNSFHVTLHRLRGALGAPEGVRVDGGRYSVDPNRIAAFDAPLFEAEAREALAALRKARRGAAGAPALDALLAALGRYRGELLQGEPAGEWHLEPRDRLHQLYLEALAAAGPPLLEADRYDEAEAVYRRWIEADDLNEAAYRGALLSLEAAGRRQDALQLYKRLAGLLRRELEVEPEAETRAIHERLRRG